MDIVYIDRISAKNSWSPLHVLSQTQYTDDLKDKASVPEDPFFRALYKYIGL